MEWTKCLQQAVSFMERHLLDHISPDNIAQEVYISSFYLQKGFKIMTGYSIGEYMRYRRLYLAALDAMTGREKIIDLAVKYGYDTPESFTKAFTRFHGISPMQIQNHAEKIRTFLPLKVKVSIQGGSDMDYAVEKMNEFKVIGFERMFSFDSAYQEIPQFWGDFLKRCRSQENPSGTVQQAVMDYHIGEFGVSIDNGETDGRFLYMIAGAYTGGEIPEGLSVFAFPDMDWAKFNCTDPMPGALQSVNTKIFREWLPTNPEYEIAMGASIEWYSKGEDISSLDYESAIWIPVKKK